MAKFRKSEIELSDQHQLWKQHSRLQIEYERAQERNTIIEVLEQYLLVAKFIKYEVGLSNQH